MPLTNEDIERLNKFVDAWNEGGSVKAAEVLGVKKNTAGTIASWVRMAGAASIQHRGRGPGKCPGRILDKEALALAKQMRRAGVMDTEIAKHFGVSKKAIFLRLGARRSAAPTVEQFLAMKQAAE